MTEKERDSRIRRSEGVEDSRIWKRKGSRIRGFKGSSGERQRVRRLEGWRVGYTSTLPNI